MEYLYIGKIVNTHGIKGELRILSDFEFKDKVFKKGFKFYIGKDHHEEVVLSYRHHKVFEMVVFEAYNDINQVLKYLKEDVYINRDDLILDDNEILDKDLIGLDVYEDNELLGKVKDVSYASPKNKLIEVKGTNNKTFYIPYNDNFILDINLQDKKIKVKLIKGMI